MSILQIIKDAQAAHRQDPRPRVHIVRSFLAAQEKAETRQIERAAKQQEVRAARMSGKVLRGNRRAAKASMRAAALREQAATRIPQP